MNVSTIKSKLNDWGIKHSWFAEKMGVSKGLVSQWFSGELDMSEDHKSTAKDIISGLGQAPA